MKTKSSLTPYTANYLEIALDFENLFPTPVGRLDLNKPFTKKEIQFINELKRRPNVGNETSEDYYIFKSKELKRVSDLIDKAVNDYFKRVFAPERNVRLYVTQSWANYSKKGQFHHKHHHPNSIVSGVLYVNAVPEIDRIYFYSDKEPMLEITTKDWNVWNSKSWWLPVATNNIVLFPSTFTHMVEEVINADERVSISFNTFVIGEIGDNKNLTELIL